MFPKCGQNVKEVCPKGKFLDFDFGKIITVKALNEKGEKALQKHSFQKGE